MRAVGVGVACAIAAAACGKSRADGDAGSVVSAPSATAPGAPRAGMAWIPAGVLRAGSPLDDVPRVPESELPGTEVPMGGFYIDVLPWPNEEGAIPTTNVSREEAQTLCDGKGKRLCSELEWERACKGPDNSRYEYGATYDAGVCGAGASMESSARRPSGAHPACRSAFGVRDMHGGAWEWTDSKWGRGATRDFGVLRGGNDPAGELRSRCAFARAVGTTERSPQTGFRCCAGPRTDAEVQLEVKIGPPFERTPHPSRRSPPLDALEGVECGPPLAPDPCSLGRAWTWRPSANVELSLAGGCVGRDPSARCALAIARVEGSEVRKVAEVDCGREVPEVVLVRSDDNRVRVRGADAHGVFYREIAFLYGRIEIREVH